MPDLRFTIEQYIPVTAAGTSEVWEKVYAYPNRARVVSAQFMPATSRTANDTNYTDISIEIDGTEICSEQTTTGDTGNLTAGTEITLALTASGKSLEMTSGSRLAFKKTDAGTGLALDGCITMLCEEVR